ncbi:MAG: type II secretion system protein [Pseudomonadota bacterium]|nr:type II secretion system protein [Pseudomonadota bacterium]
MILIVKKNGWTLIELLIVLSILGLLMALAIPQFSPLLTRQDETLQKQLMLEMLGSIQLSLRGRSDFTAVCDQHKQDFGQQLSAYELSVECQKSGGELVLLGQSNSHRFQLSNKRGFFK